MVAQVIKLPTVTTNNFQSGQSGIPVESAKAPAQNVQAEATRAKKIAEQAAQNVEAVRNAAKELNEFTEENSNQFEFFC